MKPDLLTLAKAGCSEAVRAGAHQADVFVENSRLVEVEVEASSVRYCDVKEDPGYSIRAVNKGGKGFMHGMGLSERKIRTAAARAAEMAAFAHPDPDFRSLPAPEDHIAVEGLFDPQIAEITSGEAVRWAGEIIEAGCSVSQEVILRAGITLRMTEVAVANSLGVATAEKFSSASVYVFAIVRRGDDVGSFYDFSRARSLKDLSPPSELSRKTVQKALSYLGARKIPSGIYPLLLAPMATSELIHELCAAASAENIQKNRSYLIGRKDTAIGTELLTIHDDGLVRGGEGSSAFDAEGVPRKLFRLIEKGVLTGYFHNSYTAAKSGEPNTAHAARAGYYGDVGIGCTNLRIATGTHNEAEIVKNIADGLYIDSASFSPNLSSGDISATIDFGWKIENGELAYPVANTMLGSNMLVMLKRIESVSSDFRDDAGSILPSLLIGDTQVASAG
ncbi:MAG: TldD/PmbA family protein [bacterium]